jgi:uncharacterized protein YdaU (DUF1376 family)
MRRSKFDEQSPAYQFYASDWISDPRRLKMPLESQGAYILLHSHCWISRLIEFDFEIMSKMCNCRLEKIQKIWPTIEFMFEKKIISNKEFLICIEAEDERREQALNRKKRSVAGKKGADALWNKRKEK